MSLALEDFFCLLKVKAIFSWLLDSYIHGQDPKVTNVQSWLPVYYSIRELKQTLTRQPRGGGQQENLFSKGLKVE